LLNGFSLRTFKGILPCSWPNIYLISLCFRVNCVLLMVKKEFWGRHEKKKFEHVYVTGSGAVLARSSQPMVGLMMNFRKWVYIYLICLEHMMSILWFDWSKVRTLSAAMLMRSLYVLLAAEPLVIKDLQGNRSMHVMLYLFSYHCHPLKYCTLLSWLYPL